MLGEAKDLWHYYITFYIDGKIKFVIVYFFERRTQNVHPVKFLITFFVFVVVNLLPMF